MKKIVILLVCLLFCLCLPIFLSCKNSQDDSGKKDSGDIVSGDDGSVDSLDGGDADASEESPYPDLPDIKFDGYEMKFLVRNEEHMIFYSKDIYAEEENGDPINDAVYRRNRIIEDRYDVKISHEAVANPYMFIQKLINAGDCPYDVMIEATVGSVSLSAKNMLVDLKTVPYLDFDRAWWNKTLTSELTIGGKLFCNASDMIVADKDGTWAVFFNKNLIQDYGLEDPYRLVGDGTWTFDKFSQMSKAVSVDLNSDGKYTIGEDMFGFATEKYNIFVMCVGAGCRVAEKDANDLPVLVANNQRFLAAYEKAVEIDKDISTISANSTNMITGLASPWYDGIMPAFNSGRIMFYMGSMALMPTFRGMEQDFGILPIPKFDESQEKYYTTMSVGNNGAIYIPTTNTELERTGILIEALSAESKNTLLPAYYDVTLKTKLSRDDESSDMLDILFADRIIDVGALYNFGGIFDLVTSFTDNFVSGYEKIEAKANNEIQKLIDELSTY